MIAMREAILFIFITSLVSISSASDIDTIRSPDNSINQNSKTQAENITSINNRLDDIERIIDNNEVLPKDTESIPAIAGIQNQNKKAGPQIPPLNPGRITLEVAGGVLGGCSSFLITMWPLVYLVNTGDTSSEHASDVIAYSFPIGYTLAGASSVFLIGNIGDQTGSYWATLGAASLMTIVSVASCNFDSKHSSLYSSFSFLAPVWATIGFNLTRKYKKSAIDNGHTIKRSFILENPKFALAKDPKSGSIVYHASIISIVF
jgi:hypothetical protein